MVKIGLEIHGYLDTKEKLFCSCPALHDKKLGAKPNNHICPICTGQPGSKPLLPNSSAVEKAIQISLILNCKINEKLVWQRKHYSWPDLPKGYQNTISGPHAIPVGIKGNFIEIGITECHLEEDPAAWNPKTGQVDYNRSGSPLIEIVTDPDFTSSEQVAEWLKQLITTLGYIKALDKKAGIKADVNVSLPEKKGVRVEIKNVNSITSIKNAIDSEIQRQGSNVPKIQETRRYNSEKNTTTLMRTKEQAADYRFIPDPDLPIVQIKKQRVEKIKKSLPETPQQKLTKLLKKHKIPKQHAEVLTKKLEVVDLFEQVNEKIPTQKAIDWILIELLGRLNYAKKSLADEDIEIQPNHLIELIQLVEQNKLTENKAKEILRDFIPKSFSPSKLAKSQSTISDKSQIEKIISKVIKDNAKAVQDFQSGQQNALNFLIGQVMKLSEKRADFKTVKEILEKKLK